MLFFILKLANIIDSSLSYTYQLKKVTSNLENAITRSSPS